MRVCVCMYTHMQSHTHADTHTHTQPMLKPQEKSTIPLYLEAREPYRG